MMKAGDRPGHCSDLGYNPNTRLRKTLRWAWVGGEKLNEEELYKVTEGEKEKRERVNRLLRG